jgi:hypothetical protein
LWKSENWYLGVFWSEEFVGSDELSIQCNFYEPTIFKMAANKIVKIVKMSMVSDFNENWYLGVFWSEEILIWGSFGNFCGCIQIQLSLVIESPSEVLGTSCFCTVSYYYHYYYYYYVTPNAVGWRIAILRFFFTIIIILILPHIFVRSISRRCLDQTLWGIQNYFKSPFFCFHGNCGNVCPTDSDFLAYLVSLAVDVVPIKFHQFLFGE